MADVVFRYLLMARDRDQAWYRRAFLADERLLAAGVERLIETVALRIGVGAQHERITTMPGVAPASHAGSMQWFDEPEPIRPATPFLETRTERFPLRATLKIDDCTGCRKTGQLECTTCGGTGKATCPMCRGSGHQGERSRSSCRDCSGDGVVKCPICRGHLFIKHARCGGEGMVATWQEQVHSYSVQRLQEEHLPSEAPERAMANAVEQWLTSHHEVLPDLHRDRVARHLGYETPEVSIMLALAEQSHERLERETRLSQERCLFVVSEFQLVPVAACVFRSEHSARAARYWLIGRGEDALEIRPSPVVDRWKLAGWPGLFAGATSGAQAVAAAHGLSLFGAAVVGSTLGEVLLSGVAVAGLAAASIGLKRSLFGQRSPVRTIAILPCSGKPTSYLALLAILGSFTRRLEIVDRSYRAQLEAVLGESQPPTQSRSIVVRLLSGELVRLIELARPETLSRSEMTRMVEVVDGIVFLEDPGHPADALRSRLHASTTARPPEFRLRLSASTGAGAAGATLDGGLALEVLRKAFVRELELNIDWQAAFGRLWEAIAKVLSGRKLPAVWRDSGTDHHAPGAR